jgi:DNA modification methylase
MLTLLQGDALEQLQTLESKSVQCCVTSPPYWGLRDYGATSQLGLEPTLEAYIANMVAVFRQVSRVLRDDGTFWLNMGDSYGQNQGNGFDTHSDGGIRKALAATSKVKTGLKPKDLCGIPWRLAFALQADGWYLRSDIIWHKPNPMPESVTDRPTKAHEYIFLLAKQERYFYDADAIKEPVAPGNEGATTGFYSNRANAMGIVPSGNEAIPISLQPTRSEMRNKRSVWTIPTQPYVDAHFATFPEEIPKLCILAGSKLGDTVLDPFAGSGTTGQVAIELGRRAVLIELNPDYCEMIRVRCTTTIGLSFTQSNPPTDAESPAQPIQRLLLL